MVRPELVPLPLRNVAIDRVLRHRHLKWQFLEEQAEQYNTKRKYVNFEWVIWLCILRQLVKFRRHVGSLSSFVRICEEEFGRRVLLGFEIFRLLHGVA